MPIPQECILLNRKRLYFSRIYNLEDQYDNKPLLSSQAKLFIYRTYAIATIFHRLGLLPYVAMTIVTLPVRKS